MFQEVKIINSRSNLVPLRGKKLGYTGERQEEIKAIVYWYYYPCLLQSVPVYLLRKTSNLNVGSSSLSARTSNINDLQLFTF